MIHWKVKIRKFHRYLGLIIGIQLLFWTLSGLYFSLVPIERVRGEDLVAEQVLAALNLARAPLGPAEVLARYQAELGPIYEIRLIHEPAGPVYVLYGEGKRPRLLVDAYSGEKRVIDPEVARARARADYGNRFPAGPAVLLQRAPSEYAGSLPVYQVQLEDARRTRIYLSPVTGQILAHRNDYWRVFDFLWRLHILDFNTGEDINNNFLRLASVLGLILVLSGFLLWLSSRKRRRQGTKSPIISTANHSQPADSVP